MNGIQQAGGFDMKRFIQVLVLSLLGLFVLLFVLPWLFVLLVWATQGGPDWDVPLPGGYKLWSSYSNCVILSGPQPYGMEWEGPQTVGPNVDLYQVVGHIVVGHVSFDGLDPKARGDTEGYFIVNTRTHEIRQGFDEGSWMRALSRYGIKEKPHMHRPTGLDKLLRRNR